MMPIVCIFSLLFSFRFIYFVYYTIAELLHLCLHLQTYIVINTYKSSTDKYYQYSIIKKYNPTLNKHLGYHHNTVAI